MHKTIDKPNDRMIDINKRTVIDALETWVVDHNKVSSTVASKTFLRSITGMHTGPLIKYQGIL